jgi:cytochrome c oxidase subunit 2
MEAGRTVRLLGNRETIPVPSNVSIRVIATSEDVIHSWTVPSIGVKIDASPGRLNQAFMTIKRLGVFTGQCSEICGANHSFIPIVLKSMSTVKFTELIKQQ